MKNLTNLKERLNKYCLQQEDLLHLKGGALKNPPPLPPIDIDTGSGMPPEVG